VLRGLMTDEEWAIVEPFITTPSLRGERPPANHRRVLDDILWICRAGAPWRDLPEAFGNWNSIWRQFRRWCESGVWDVLLQGLADSGRELDALQMIDSTTIRAHRCAAGKKPGSNFRHLAVLAAGSPPKSISAANAVGRPVGVVLTAGESHDVTAYDAPMEQRDSDPGAMLADKGYDSDAIRHDLQDRGTAPEIPTKSNRKVQHSVSKRLYRLRSRIECCIGHLKEQRRVATRYDKTTTIFLGFVLLGCIRLWIRFVHRA
jgi:transposase